MIKRAAEAHHSSPDTECFRQPHLFLPPLGWAVGIRTVTKPSSRASESPESADHQSPVPVIYPMVRTLEQVLNNDRNFYKITPLIPAPGCRVFVSCNVCADVLIGIVISLSLSEEESVIITIIGQSDEPHVIIQQFQTVEMIIITARVRPITAILSQTFSLT